jgi:hypothetical protein
MAIAGRKIKEHRVEMKHSELALKFLREGEELLDKGEEVERHWEAAWFLHVEGFHETRLDINSVKRRLKYVKKLVEMERNL